MKKLALALAVAIFSGSALAADLPVRTYSKAPAMIEPTPSWTGFYVFGGFGGGLWDAKESLVTSAGVPLQRDETTGGHGWYGTVGAGYDWQFNNSWVAGIFADGQFGSIQGSIVDQGFSFEGRETLRNSWAAGVRLGYLVAPNVYSYLNTGYNGSQWSGAALTTLSSLGGPLVETTPSFWFFGGGVENNLNVFGASAAGLFMKTEYRAAYFDRVVLPETLGGVTLNSITFKPIVQTISSSLVYRFNWTGAPVVAKY
jgi:outer membrane immunogenic protein